ncbi:MAG: 50S ribosomal protein L18 [Reichenbachiella sp.]
MAITKEQRRLRIRRGIRNKVSGTTARPRLSVFKSNKGIYVQLVDDENSNTMVATSSLELGKANANIDVAKEVGKSLAEKATKSGISVVVFDRGGYPYHGKVKALAEGAREGGLKF